jgi:hypothetical protein
MDDLGIHLLWCSCRNEHTITHGFFEILSQLLFWKVDPMYRERFSPFPPLHSVVGQYFCH